MPLHTYNYGYNSRDFSQMLQLWRTPYEIPSVQRDAEKWFNGTGEMCVLRLEKSNLMRFCTDELDFEYVIRGKTRKNGENFGKMSNQETTTGSNCTY